MRCLVVVAAVALLGVGQLQGQAPLPAPGPQHPAHLLPAPSSLLPDLPLSDDEPWVGWPVIGGLLLGTVGWFGGALIALEIAEDCGEGLCALDDVIYAGALTGTAGLALGVHLGNGRRGNFGLDFLTASGVWLTGFTLVLATGSDDLASALAFAVPIGQLWATTAVERAKGREKARRRVEVYAVPAKHRLLIGSRISF